jgi:hypothetical protein
MRTTPRRDNLWRATRKRLKPCPMKRWILLIVTTLVGTSFPITAQTQPGTPFSLTLRAIHGTVQLGSDITVELTTTNNLGRPLKLSKSNPGTEYQIDVRDAKGQAVAPTALYKELQNPQFVFRLTSQILKPEESSKEEFNIDKFFVFDNTGTYSIQVQRTIPRQVGSGAVKSNTVVITITAKQ